MPNFNLRASSPIWASEASLARTRGKNIFTVTVPLCSNACHTWTWQVSIQFSRWKACNRFAYLCFKSASKVAPPLSLFGSHFIFRQNRKSRSSSFGLSLPRNHTETLELAWLLRLPQGGFSCGLQAFEFVTEVVWTCVNKVEWLWGKKTITSVLARGLSKFARARREPQVAQPQYEGTCGWSLWTGSLS